LKRKKDIVFWDMTCIEAEYVGSEVLTAMFTKRSIFWDITPCSPLKVNRLHGVISQKILLLKQRLSGVSEECA
jgi:hypothetical protein